MNLTRLTLVVAFAFSSVAAQAHAVLMRSTPTNDSIVFGSELDIDLRFNSRLDAKRSRLTLLAPEGRSVVLPLAPIDAPDALSAHAAALEPGDYKLHWQALSVDGHIAQGDISFHVNR
jgi:methionine-rich copper-binding protein CopC